MSEAATEIQNEVTAELPEGWRMATIGELLKVRNGYAFSSKDYTESGTLLVRQSNLGGDTVSMRKAKYLPAPYLAEHPEYQVHKGDILIGMSGSIGKLCTYDLDEPALQNQRTGLLVFQDEDQKRWVWHYLPLLEQGLKEIGKGVAVQNVSAKQIESFSIPVAPLEDQKRIVAEIEKQFSRLDEAVASLKRVKANLKRYKAAVLKAAVEGKLTEEWRKQNPDVEPASKLLERILAERRTKWEETELAKMKAKGKEPKNDKWKEKYKEPPSPVLDGLPQLPTTWIWASPEQLASTMPYSLAIGPFGSNLKVKDYCESGVPLVFVRNIRNSDFGVDGARYVSAEKAKELAAHSVEGGDILITKMGDPPGDACLYPTDSPRAIITADCIKWRLSSLLPFRDYFVDTVNSQCLAEQIKKITKGVAQQKVSLARFRAIAVPLPPVGEQSSIEDAVTGIDSIVAAETRQVNTALKKAESLRQSILAKSFLGELTTGASNASY